MKNYYADIFGNNEIHMYLKKYHNSPMPSSIMVERICADVKLWG
jgi:hypothetical protein